MEWQPSVSDWFKIAGVYYLKPEYRPWMPPRVWKRVCDFMEKHPKPPVV